MNGVAECCVWENALHFIILFLSSYQMYNIRAKWDHDASGQFTPLKSGGTNA